MFIEPIECSRCGRKSRPGDAGFQASYGDPKAQIVCECGNEFYLREPRDQFILSRNPFSRFSAASNHFEFGTVEIIPGQAIDVAFGRPFDYPCKTYLTSEGIGLYLREAFLNNDRMLIVSAVPSGGPVPTIPVRVHWAVYGLIDLNLLPNWYVQFFAAMTQIETALYKAALFDYAIAFEVFFENWLDVHLTARYGRQLSEYLMKRIWRIEDRCKDLMELAINRRFTERMDVYQLWDHDVREPRNRLAHGERFEVTREMAEAAHSAVYQGIRWIESVTP
jgi:hypothetical protein